MQNSREKSLTQTYTVKTPRQMEKLGKGIAKELTGGDVLLLSGELGAGKTVFCKGVALGLGVKSQVVSPTFTIMNEHDGKAVKFCHFDAYRLADESEAYGAGVTDFIGNELCVCAVEWWENIEPLFDGLKTVKVSINKIGSAREVVIER